MFLKKGRKKSKLNWTDIFFFLIFAGEIIQSFLFKYNITYGFFLDIHY